MASILVLHGPNLNLLGRREPSVYGHTTLEEINTKLKSLSSCDIVCLQSNAEHVLIDRIQATLDDSTQIILFNPAAFTHSSIALRDALLATQTPFIEIHLSDIRTREDFRQHSYFSDIAIATYQGHGADSYYKALEHAKHYLTDQQGVIHGHS
ncbi:MAG: 3-dehydroquinate dehydratase [Gammaproteobacteria bacterium CG11_big_fil_rev_8_21_14_0_20_46_22]|nr:MAG: 3-dehydroquinate dehydratase [Gammaproteobacteria bacterium CG12_big_fil_rev_8_21_14_0_65_46_12]PIR10533.1 MAG: 3-dehydroquinate dehydratase [Gammaproteobacteria bacterium CG11_big_fil_rev_8_21_14_0_20_46_22]